MTEPLLTVAFIVMITAFFKKQIGLTGWKTLVAAAIVSLVVALLPQIAATVPASAPWIGAVLQWLVLFFSAAGSVDFVTLVRTSSVPPTPGVK
jgi:hypothetical protein